MTSPRHSLLRRQIRRHVNDADSSTLQPFLSAVDEAYEQFDLDRKLLERSLDLSSAELTRVNREMRVALEMLQAAQGKLQSRVEFQSQQLTAANEQLRQAEALEAVSRELARSNEELEQFAYVASHDLKAPLRAIDSLSSWIEEDLGTSVPEGVSKKIALMRGRVRRMVEFIDGLLGYSRAGKTSGSVELIDTRQLVVDAATFLAVPDGITVVAHAALPQLSSPRVPLREVFLNLIGNAVKHHDRATGTIEVSAVVSGEFYEFRVKDDGPGIDPQHHRRVFQMFQTLKARDEVEGTGLGLALVKKIVTGVGGDVTIVSDGGRGTELRFTWPMIWSAGPP